MLTVAALRGNGRRKTPGRGAIVLTRAGKFKPSRRADETVIRVRLPGGECFAHARRMLLTPAILKPLRVELMRAFAEFNGSEMRMAARINVKGGASARFEIAHV